MNVAHTEVLTPGLYKDSHGYVYWKPHRESAAPCVAHFDYKSQEAERRAAAILAANCAMLQARGVPVTHRTASDPAFLQLSGQSLWLEPMMRLQSVLSVPQEGGLIALFHADHDAGLMVYRDAHKLDVTRWPAHGVKGMMLESGTLKASLFAQEVLGAQDATHLHHDARQDAWSDRPLVWDLLEESGIEPQLVLAMLKRSPHPVMDADYDEAMADVLSQSALLETVEHSQTDRPRMRH